LKRMVLKIPLRVFPPSDERAFKTPPAPAPSGRGSRRGCSACL
jgi:hypothetical protein